MFAMRASLIDDGGSLGICARELGQGSLRLAALEQERARALQIAGIVVRLEAVLPRGDRSFGVAALELHGCEGSPLLALRRARQRLLELRHRSVELADSRQGMSEREALFGIVESHDRQPILDRLRAAQIAALERCSNALARAHHASYGDEGDEACDECRLAKRLAGARHEYSASDRTGKVASEPPRARRDSGRPPPEPGDPGVIVLGGDLDAARAAQLQQGRWLDRTRDRVHDQPRGALGRPVPERDVDQALVVRQPARVESATPFRFENRDRCPISTSPAARVRGHELERALEAAAAIAKECRRVERVSDHEGERESSRDGAAGAAGAPGVGQHEARGGAHRSRSQTTMRGTLAGAASERSAGARGGLL